MQFKVVAALVVASVYKVNATEVEAQIQALARSAAVAAAKEAVSGKVALTGSLRGQVKNRLAKYFDDDENDMDDDDYTEDD